MRAVTFALGVCFAAGFCSGASAAEPAKKPTVLSRAFPTDTLQFARNISPDGQVETIIFDDLQAGTGLSKSDLPNVSVKTFTYVVAVDGDKPAKLAQDFRGYVNTQGSGKATLIITAGGQSTVVDLKRAIKDAKAASKPLSETHSRAKEIAKSQGLTIRSPSNVSDDFLVSVDSPEVSKDKPLQTTVVIIVEQLKAENDGALLAIDSIELSLK